VSPWERRPSLASLSEADLASGYRTPDLAHGSRYPPPVCHSHTPARQRRLIFTYIFEYIHQDTNLNILFISGNCSTCFGWYFHPSSGAHTTVTTVLYWYWYLSHRYCYMSLSWRSWNWFECAVGGVPHPQHTQVVCAPDDGWRYHPKHVEQFSDTNKLCNVASFWIYIGTYLRCKDP